MPTNLNIAPTLLATVTGAFDQRLVAGIKR